MSTLTKCKDVILFENEMYNTFPNAVVTDEGKVLIGFRQAPDRTKLLGQVTHIDPESKAVSIASDDQGQTWPREAKLIVEDLVCGVQDPCITKLRDGTLFTTFFTWKLLEKEDVSERRPWDVDFHERWVARIGGVFSVHSTDHGATWSTPVPIPGGGKAVRGNPVELEDGTLILPTYGGEETKGQIFILSTTDRGQSWERLAILEIEDYLFHEPNLFLTPSGKLVMLTRSRNMAGEEPNGLTSPLFTSESADGGRSWSPFVKRPFYSPSPFHALQLKSGRVLVTYGYRFEPYGIRAFLMDSEFTAWEQAEDIVLRDDAAGFDIGYTSSVQLDNGDILVTYYYCDDAAGRRYIAGTWCREA